MNDYTPTTEEVRERFMREMPLGDEFDRWLAQERAKAWNEGFDYAEHHYYDKNPYRKDADL